MAPSKTQVWAAWAWLLKGALEHSMEKYCPSDSHLLIFSQYPAQNRRERQQGEVCSQKEPEAAQGGIKALECSVIPKPWGNILESRPLLQTFCDCVRLSGIKTDFVQGQKTLCFAHGVQQMVDWIQPLF